mgnify:CR=1 FL=1
MLFMMYNYDGDIMRKYLYDYIENIDRKIRDGKIDDKCINEHLIKISFFQLNFIQFRFFIYNRL